MTDLRTTIEKTFSQKTVVILGDLVADQFLNGTIQRVSREAPVFIMRHDDTDTLPGAAANAAANVASLGGKALLIGVAGEDANGELLLSALRSANVDTKRIVTRKDLVTTTKVRVIAGQNFASKRQVIRIDYEPSAKLPDEIKTELRANLAEAAETVDGIIVSDYNYGAIFPELYNDALEIANSRSIPLVVDSRFRLSEYKGATSATPNRDEAEQILGKDFGPDDCLKLRDRLELQALLVTNGNEGMQLFETGAAPLKIDAVGSPVAVDVTGAGDTVIAAYTLGLASGLSFAEAGRIANHAGGIVVMKKRTATVTGLELLASIGANTDSAQKF